MLVTPLACAEDVELSQIDRWSIGAVLRVNDLAYLGDIPAFATPTVADPVAVVEAAALLGALGESIAEPLSLVDLMALNAVLSNWDELVVIEQYLMLGRPLSASEREYLWAVLGRVDPEDEVTAFRLDLVRRALGQDLEPAPACPERILSADDLYGAGVSAARNALRDVACPRVRGDLASLMPPDDELTAELIEYSRALGLLASVGAVDPTDLEPTRVLLANAVGEAAAERPSRSLVQMLHHAWTADAEVARAMSSYAPEIGAWSRRTIRWGGALPDSVDGADVRSTTMALRIVRVLDVNAARSFWEDVIPSSHGLGAPDGYWMAMAVALGETDAVHLTTQDIRAAPLFIAAPLLARYAPCDAWTSRGPDFEAMALLDDEIGAAVAAHALRCEALVNPPVPDGSLSGQAAYGCLAFGTVDRSLTEEAQREVDRLDWQWRALEIPSIDDIYERVVLLRLSDGSCDGFWWWIG